MTAFEKISTRLDPPKRDVASQRSPPHLHSAEVDKLVAAARRLGRHGHRDATMILLAYRHGLCVSELVEMRRDQVDLKNRQLHIRHCKSGIQTIHALTDLEAEALAKLFSNTANANHVFVSERHSPMTCANVRRLVTRAGETAGLSLSVHPHMLRHSTGFRLANEGQDIGSIQRYLGHRNVQHAVIYRSGIVPLPGCGVAVSHTEFEKTIPGQSILTASI